jgi:Fe(3+) dicitrate transport protein
MSCSPVFFLTWFWVSMFPIFAVSAQSEKGRIDVRVLDARGQGLPFVSVAIEGASKSGTANASGFYAFKDLEYGVYLILIRKADSGWIRKPVTLTDSVLEVVVQSDIRIRNLKEVSVQGGEVEALGMGRLRNVDQFGIYSGRKSEVVQVQNLNANLATNNPRQVFGRVAGLNIWESDGAGLQLGIGGRGLSPNRTANFNVRQNGYDISADALGYPESYYTPPMEALEKIEVVRGAASLQYGTQFGGLVNFRFLKPAENKPVEVISRQTIGSWGFFNSFTKVSGTVSKGRLKYSAFGQFKRGDGYRPNSSFRSGNGYIGIQWTPKQGWFVEADWTRMGYLAQQPGGLTDRNFADNPRRSFRNRNWFDVDWNLASLSLTRRFSSRTQLNIRNFGLLAYRRSLGNLDRINVVDFGQNRTLIDGRFSNFGSESRLLHRYTIPQVGAQTLLVGGRFYSGVTTARQGDSNADAGPDFQFLGAKPNLSDYRFPSLNLALFGEQIWHLGKAWSLTPGVRWEHIQTRAEGTYSIRTFDGAGNVIAEVSRREGTSRSRSFFLGGLGLAWNADSIWDWYGNISQNYRAINFSDLRIENPNLVVDTNLRDEKGFTADLGFRGKKEGFFSLEATFFYIRYSGKIGQVLRNDRAPLYNDYRFRTNIADARNLGLELFGEVELMRLVQRKASASGWKVNLFLNFAWVDARYVQTQDPSIRNRKVEMVPPFMLRSGVQVRKGGFSMGYQNSWVGAHYSDATNALRTATAVEGIIPAYSVSDVSIGFVYQRYKLEGSVNNAFNSSYFTRRAESYPGPGIIPSDGRSFFLTLAVKI